MLMHSTQNKTETKCEQGFTVKYNCTSLWVHTNIILLSGGFECVCFKLCRGLWQQHVWMQHSMFCGCVLLGTSHLWLFQSVELRMRGRFVRAVRVETWILCSCMNAEFYSNARFTTTRRWEGTATLKAYQSASALARERRVPLLENSRMNAPLLFEECKMISVEIRLKCMDLHVIPLFVV